MQAQFVKTCITALRTGTAEKEFSENDEIIQKRREEICTG